MKFTRGYKPVRDKLRKGSKYNMSCYNCEYYYQTPEDTEEVCQNTNVSKYDMVITDNKIYCNFWKMCDHRKKRGSVNEPKQIKIKKSGKKSSKRD